MVIWVEILSATSHKRNQVAVFVTICDPTYMSFYSEEGVKLSIFI